MRFTYDTVCGNGDILFERESWYIPRPLQQHRQPRKWISPVTLVLGPIRSSLADGVGREPSWTVTFTMEWYRSRGRSSSVNRCHPPVHRPTS